MRYVSLVTTLFLATQLFISCAKNPVSSLSSSFSDTSSLNPDDKDNYQKELCKKYGYCPPGGDDGNSDGGEDSGGDTGGSDGGDDPIDDGEGCATGNHTVGDIATGGHCGKGKLIPITFVFVGSSSKTLSQDPQADAQKALDNMNEQFSHLGHEYIQFKIKEAIEVKDDQYHNTTCNALSSVSSKYSSSDSMVMLFVNDLQGSCAGVSWLWVFPKDSFSVTMAEYKYPFQQNSFTVVTHEFAHSFGLHHTGNEYNGSVPTTGLKTFNQIISMGGRNSRRCPDEFKYFIDPQARNTSASAGGLNWNSYHNTMYPSFGGQPDNGFFTDGYDYAMSWAFSCWYRFAIDDL